MAGFEPDWRVREASLDEVLKKYPRVSPFVVVKIDAQRRGVRFSDQALALVDRDLHQVEYRGFSRETVGTVPVSLIMRDGTSILTGFNTSAPARSPYLVDVREGRLFLTDEGRAVEEVFYWEKPDYYNLKTSRGVPMWRIALARPQRLDLYPFQDCQFWRSPGQGCKYCAIAATYRQTDKPDYVEIGEIEETLAEALKEPGRYMSLFLTGGSIISGREPLDDEVDLYIKVLRAAGRFFQPGRFPSQLIATAFTKKQLTRLHRETGLASYTADIEVLDREKFEWICPGKAKLIGYEEWKKRLCEAVEVFGPGRVNTGLVGGVEMARPHGFPNEEEALAATLAEAESLARRGVSVVYCVWTVAEGSIFFNQKSPSLEYYVRLAEGLDGLRRTYGLNIDMDNYRRCGNHPDTDLSRVWED